MSKLASLAADFETQALARAKVLAGREGLWDNLQDHDIHAYPKDVFTLEEYSAAYRSAIDTGGEGSQQKAEHAKVEAAAVTGMHRATVMRYTRSRIWHYAAAYSRRRALSEAKQISRLPDFVAAGAKI
jgi:ABC-type arginine/histidine transport system permease subunit